jgi:hypothetical protein
MYSGPLGVNPLYCFGITTFSKPSLTASIILRSKKYVFFTIPVSDTSPRKMVLPRDFPFFELMRLAIVARSTPGSERVNPLQTFT